MMPDLVLGRHGPDGLLPDQRERATVEVLTKRGGGTSSSPAQSDGSFSASTDVRESVVEGGGPVPPGTVLVRVLPDGSHEIVRRS